MLYIYICIYIYISVICIYTSIYTYMCIYIDLVPNIYINLSTKYWLGNFLHSI